jgi:HAD superfamily hydrolase (TIGR01509 family)
MSRVLALLWDLDGVIVDSGHFHYMAYREVLAPLGVDLTEERYTTGLFGKRNDDILRDVLGEGVPDDQITRVAALKEEAFRRLVRGNVTPLPGAVALLSRARETGLRQCIVSSTPRANIELVLESLAVRQMLDAIVGEEDVSRGKPDPEGFLTGAERLAVSPSASIVLEDAPDGIAAGKSAGMRCIGVATTRPPERLAQADLVVPSLEDEGVLRYLFG